jgi:hypothetical protein
MRDDSRKNSDGVTWVLVVSALAAQIKRIGVFLSAKAVVATASK